jgi:serine/threonine protein kinase
MFEAERAMLAHFSDNAHDHVISLLASYKQHNSSCFIFPRAEADLLEFWTEKHPKPDFEKTVPWVAVQCEGLADGLLQIHKYKTSVKFPQTQAGAGGAVSGKTPTSSGTAEQELYGSHGDIKPANILWFPGSSPKDSNDARGTLKLSDFGLAEVHTADSRSDRSRSRVATSLPYRPPECDMENGKIGQSFDIWTLGCLYLEFITWLLGGWDLLKEFNLKRLTPAQYRQYGKTDSGFFQLQEYGRAAKLKDSVTEVRARMLHS